jgi:hypothetical protein
MDVTESSQLNPCCDSLSTQFFFGLREYCDQTSHQQQQQDSTKEKKKNVLNHHQYPYQLKDNERVNYSLRCPHSGVIITPNSGSLNKFNAGILVTVSISRHDAKFLQCTSIEVIKTLILLWLGERERERVVVEL